MKIKLIFLLAFVNVCTFLSATTYHIKQDGSGDFTTIQEGINISADTDTILVYAGTYFESINYNSKNITVASLYLTTGDEQHISQTIIDGNNEYRCVRIENCQNISLIGFTIQNGYAVGGSSSGWGGGVLILNLGNGIVSNCRIINNTATLAGGSAVASSSLILKSNTFSENYGIIQGGGLDIECSNITFDPVFLNSVFSNYSPSGCDIYMYDVVSGGYYDVVLDTFTVTDFDEFFISPLNCEASLSVQNHVLEQIDHDLFVAPDGSDDNSGLTPDDPLQTIAWAQTLIKRNDSNPHTIHLALGTYSPTLNNQKFPLGIKHGVTIQGTVPDSTILNGDNQYNLFRYSYYNSEEFPELRIKGITMTNSRDTNDTNSAIKTLKANLLLENVIITDCYGNFTNAILCRDGIYNFKNVQVLDNTGGQAIRISCIYGNNPEPLLSVNMENCLVQDNSPSPDPTSGYGGGLQFTGHLTIPGNYYASLISCDINSNYSSFLNGGAAGTTGLYASNHITADIVNCTFGDNIVIDTTGCVITGATEAEVNIYNSIIYGNVGHSCNLLYESEVNVHHSLLEGGEDNVGFYYPVNALFNWLEGNLNEDPLWLGTGDYPYYLQSESPCIDAGTLDLPDGIELPQYDLAGNPRIFGNTIDMGAYEWQGVGIEEPELPQLSTLTTHLSNYPNPFNPTTTITLELAEAGKIELAIYNIKGQKVKTLLDCTTAPGTYECNWNGKDETGKAVSSGQYIVKLQQNSEETVKKIMLLK